MNGAEQLVHTLVNGGVDTCFTNPGTSEMHFVAALDRIPGMRCVLGLFEGVVTGAADGYYRMADRPAATLLHLGPGLANGLANLHNAKKARSGIVNIVGEHATEHLAYDAPLTSDIEGLAQPMSHWVRTSRTFEDLRKHGKSAIIEANKTPGQIATLILPANTAWTDAEDVAVEGEQPLQAFAYSFSNENLKAAAEALSHGPSTLLLLGGRALRAEATLLAGRLAAKTGCIVKSEFYAARSQRGAGRVAVPRLPYAVDPSLSALASFNRIVLVGAVPPVAFFAYPGKPSQLSRPECQFTVGATAEEDLTGFLEALCDYVDAKNSRPKGIVVKADVTSATGQLEPNGIAKVLAATLPEGAIVVDESISTGRNFDLITQNAAPHDWLTGCGGSIGFALPVAVGAAIATPGRKVLALEGDGSGMYTPQALWTMVRESLDVTVVIFANRAYQILRGEFTNVGAGAPGPRANDMLTIDRPTLDWVALANGMGMEASRVDTLEAFSAQLKRSFALGGPSLIEVIL